MSDYSGCCSHCQRHLKVEPATLSNGWLWRLCDGCLWMYANMGWLQP